MLFLNEYTELIDDTLKGKVKIFTPPLVIKKEETDNVKKFIVENREEIDKLLAFMLFAFANIKGFKEEYEKYKPLIKTFDEATYRVDMLLTKKEEKNITYFLLNETEKSDYLFQIQKVEKKEEKKAFFLFSLDIIEFDENVKLENGNYYFETLKTNKPVTKTQKEIVENISLKDILSLDLEIDIELERN